MAIAWNASLADNSLTASSDDRLFDITGSNTALVVWVEHTSARTVSSVTYNGVSLTQVHANVVGESTTRLDAWYLVGTATGSNHTVITMSGSDDFRTSALSYTGVASGSDTGGSDSKSSINWITTSGNQTLATTTIANNAWVTFYGRTVDAYTAGTNATFRQNISGVLFDGDNNADITPAGSYSITVNRAGSSSGAIVGVGMKPSGASTVNSNFLAFM